MLQNEVAERLGDQWPEDSSGHVTVELVAGNRMRGNGKGGRVEELLRFRTGELLLGEGKGGKFRERGSESSSGRRRRQWLSGNRRAREGIGDSIGSARCVGGSDSKLLDEGQLSLLAA